MNLMPSDDEENIIDLARSLLSSELPVDYRRWQAGALEAPDRRVFAQLADLGWIGLGISEARGGGGFSATEQAMLFREIGRALVTPQLLAAALAARLISSTDERAAKIIAGQIRVGLAIPSELEGNLYLIEAADADQVLVLLAEKVLLISAAAFLDRRPVRSVDATVTLESARHPDNLAASSVGDGSLVRLYASLLISALLTGSAEAVRDLTVEYAKERVQFGQRIGVFQAISHPLADMAVRCEAAVSQLKLAAVRVRDGAEDAQFQGLAAHIVALDAALANASASIQIHGGIGFAAEYPVHFHLKRAHLLAEIGGGIHAQLDQLFILNA
jgi:alkylation response protein AidB-like acyl-CoA dehydrogenase